MGRWAEWVHHISTCPGSHGRSRDRYHQPCSILVLPLSVTVALRHALSLASSSLGHHVHKQRRLKSGSSRWLYLPHFLTRWLVSLSFSIHCNPTNLRRPIDMSTLEVPTTWFEYGPLTTMVQTNPNLLLMQNMKSPLFRLLYVSWRRLSSIHYFNSASPA